MPNSSQTYGQLLLDPLNILRSNDLAVNQLSDVADATVRPLFFAVGRNGIVIDQRQEMAEVLAMSDPPDSIMRDMLVSTMRANDHPVGARQGDRHEGTRRRQGLALLSSADLWVTQLLTGCSVLIIDWGGNVYSMIHLQPSDDDQFNRLGQAIIGASHFSRAAYKNAWLKSELTSIVTNTGGTPQRYILVQSLGTSRLISMQLIGVRKNARFEFYRQTQMGRNTRRAEHLEWCGWYRFLPYRPY